MKGLLIFAAGLAVGAVTGALVIKNKVLADAKAEDEEVREYYRSKQQERGIKEVKEDKTPYVVAAVDTVVKIGCTVGAFYVFFKTLDYISEVDTKATVSNMLNIINGAKLGLIEKDVVEYMLKENAPSLDEASRALVRGYASSVFPDLVGGAIHE